MNHLVRKTVASSLFFGLLLMGFAGSVHAAKKDVEAGPIWNQADAENKCKALAKSMDPVGLVSGVPLFPEKCRYVS